MPTCKTFKARKEYKCGKCGATIHKGEEYYRIFQRFRKPIIRCKKCRPRPSELTTSDKLSRLYSASEDIEDKLKEAEPTKEFLQELLETLEFAISEAEEVGEEYNESADNMEEYFPNSPLVDEIRERADNCEEWLDELESAKDEVEALIDEWEELTEEEKGDKLDYIITVVESALSSLSI